MHKKYYADLGVRAALWRIQQQSPFCRMMPKHDEDSEARGMRPEWIPAEAGVAWAIWERAVMDANGFTSPNPRKNGMKEDDLEAARHTAETGCIVRGDGSEVGLLDALGINLEWAQDVLQSVTGQFSRMLDHGWTPDAF